MVLEGSEGMFDSRSSQLHGLRSGALVRPVQRGTHVGWNKIVQHHRAGMPFCL
jgi:hypothetical protein